MLYSLVLVACLVMVEAYYIGVETSKGPEVIEQLKPLLEVKEIYPDYRPPITS